MPASHLVLRSPPHRLAAVALFALALGVLASPLAGCTRVPQPGDDLRRAVHAAVVLLEAGNYREFLERYMIPHERERFFAGLTMEGKAEKFRDVAGARLLHRLRAADRIQPQVKPGNNEATYPLEPVLKFVRVEGTWRIVD